jgi:hypothetical protein
VWDQLQCAAPIRNICRLRELPLSYATQKKELSRREHQSAQAPGNQPAEIALDRVEEILSGYASGLEEMTTPALRLVTLSSPAFD